MHENCLRLEEDHYFYIREGECRYEYPKADRPCRNPVSGRDASYALDPPPSAGDPRDLSFLGAGLLLHEG